MHHINWVGVAAALIVGQAIGFAWYGAIFKKRWIELTGVTEGGSPMPMVIGAAVMLVSMIGLAMVIGVLHQDGWLLGAHAGLFAAVFFALPGAANEFIYARKKTALIPIDLGYILVSLVVGGALIGGVHLG